MKSLSKDMYALLSSVEGIDVGQVRRAARIKQVRDMWASLVEKEILDHTNGVYVFSRAGCRQMHVYMDESIYAAEINNRRELLKMECLERFGERIDEFEIHISRGDRKTQYPFVVEEADESDNAAHPVPLSPEERAHVASAAQSIADMRLRESFQTAMTRDLEWKKGIDRSKISKS